MRKNIIVTTAAVVAASALILNGCGSKKAEPVTTAAETTVAEITTAEETTVVETTAAAEESTPAAEESTPAAEETTAAAPEESSEEETTTAIEETTAEETTKEETTEAETTTAAAEETAAQKSGEAPSDIYSKVTGLLPGMITVDANYIANYYGIDASQLDGYVFAMAEDVTKADTVAILKAKDASAVAALAGQLSAVQQQKAQELQDYMPEQYQIVAASSVKTAGDYVYLVMSSNAAAIEQTIASSIG